MITPHPYTFCPFLFPRIVVIAVILFSVQLSFAQTSWHGRVTDSNQQPLSPVTVTVLHNSVVVDATTTEANGTFNIVGKVDKQEDIYLRFSLVGYLTLIKKLHPDSVNANLKIVLKEDLKTLNAVVVSAKKRPLIERKVDRYILNIENSGLSAGNSAMEVLQKAPGVWVSSDGNIRIKGNQTVVVMINDVVQRMSQDDLTQYLNSLRSEEISKIEIIHNPPAEYEAAGSGGIIHIILKKARQDGTTGSFYGRYRQQDSKFLASAGSSLSYKIKRFYAGANISYTHDENDSKERSTVSYPDKSVFSNSTRRGNDIYRYQYRLSAAYDLSSTQTLGLQLSGNKNRPRQVFLTNVQYNTPTGSTQGTANATWVRDIQFNGATLNYSWKMDSLGSNIKFIGDYSTNDKSEVNSLAAVYTDHALDSTFRNSIPSQTKVYTLQADVSKRLSGNSEYKYGVKYADIARDNAIVNEVYKGDVWLFNPTGSNQFVYSEKIFMGYGAFEQSFKQTNIKVGLRGERTSSKGNSVTAGQSFDRAYFGLFPSLFILQNFNEKVGNSIYFNYARRLQRPSFNDLNPYRLQLHNFMVLTGNPDLQPQYTHNFQLGVNLLKEYSADIYYTSTNQMIGLLATPIANNVIEYKPFNLSAGREFGFNAGFPFTILKSWTSQNNLSFYSSLNRINGTDFKQNTFSVKSVQTLSFKHFPTVDIYTEYRSPYLISNTRTGYLYYLDLMFSQKVLKNKGTLRLYLSDIFNTLREKELTGYNNTLIDFYQKRITRTISLAFSYNFSFGKKFSQKSIDQSNGDENRRLGN